MNKNEIYIKFAESIIEELKNGTAPWQKSWKAGEYHRPMNPITGAPYNGINTVMLSRHGYADPRWMTLVQANEKEWRVRKGSKSEKIIFWKINERAMLDATGQPVLDETGEEMVQPGRPVLRVYNVFHASQLQTRDGQDIPAYKAEELSWNPIERGEKILQDSGAVIHHDQIDKAFYRPAADEIHLPSKGNFPESGDYYSTALHELGHWTGHESRMARKLSAKGTAAYAKEELRAEISSWMLNQDLGLPHNPKDHLSYVDHWVSVLKKDPQEIMRASRDAEKIKEYVIGLQKEQEQPVEMDVAKSVEETAPAEQKMEQKTATEKTFLNVAYTDRQNAKAAGARWDGRAKLWYAPAGVNLTALASWMPGTAVVVPEMPGLSPENEFSQALQSIGLIVENPVLDGTIHRVAVMNGKAGTKDGAYCGFADGRPNGWGQNYKTNEQTKWVATGHVLTDQQKDTLKAGASEKLEERATERTEQQAKAMKRAYAKWMNAEPADKAHPYLTAKGIDNFGLKQDRNGNLLIPGFDTRTGKIQTLQWINAEGMKGFEKGCPQRESVFVIPSLESLKKEEFFVAEGYATAASVHMATGKPVAVVFNAHNLHPTAVVLREQYPHAKITICADNDHHLSSGNIGVESAEKAAKAINGTVVVPKFTKAEKEKKHTDFNDLHKAQGLKAVTAQVAPQRAVER